MDETRERFLTAIVAKIGAERIVELHLFSPIRQGVSETGVAVIAVVPDAAIEVGFGVEGVQEGAGGSAEEEDPYRAPDAEPHAEPDEGTDEETDGESDAGPDAVPETGPDAVPEGAVVALPDAAPDAAPGAVINDLPADSRHVVFTALYRLTRKGPDRGKWEFELAATADAPLATVDMVVRGVMQRSKDLTETERLSGDQLRAALAEPAWRTTP